MPHSLTWPLTGRDSELEYLHRAIAPGAPGVMVSGEMGVGKTRLTAALAEQLESDGWVVSRHLATAARSVVPFSVFATLLDGDDVPAGPLDRVRQAAGRLAGAERVVLVVDDAHFLDPESLAFVQHVAESPGATVLLTVRSGHPCAHPVRVAAEGAGLRRLELQPLGEREVDTLLRSVWPEATAARRRALWDLTRGNPLYLNQVVRRAVEDPGVIRFDSAPLSEVVGDRLRGLSEAEQAVLELIVVGGVVEVAVLSELVDAEAVASLERWGLVQLEESGDRVVARMGHPVYGEVVGERMGVAVRRLRRGGAARGPRRPPPPAPLGPDRPGGLGGRGGGRRRRRAARLGGRAARRRRAPGAARPACPRRRPWGRPGDGGDAGPRRQ